MKESWCICDDNCGAGPEIDRLRAALREVIEIIDGKCISQADSETVERARILLGGER